ncbi:MAG TPA: hypothetical protein VJN29_17565 [Intrasporangium sp.]|uniref:hypothetical protein n=1 Tax=Intrasporangium sp. TaxID=1925024 RepID=UPI002B490ECC|nr:hypothetical protein [Intrasporangium sp.]HKX69027.1 hypothetical protein [Intrasporangium sp.]
MDRRLQALAGTQGGTFSAAEALAVGLTSAELHRAVGSRELVPVRRRAYVTAVVWAAAAAEERYRLACCAIARTRPDDALSHHAALALLGLPLWGHDPTRVDLVTAVRQGVRRGSTWLHPDEQVDTIVVDGLRVVSPARAIVRTALTMGRDCAVVAGDAALHRRLVTLEELLAEVARVTPHQGRTRALEAVLAMDRKAESVGESRTRLIFVDLGLAHESQVVITGQAGAFVARVDFLVEGVVVEFDGRTKYGRARDEDDGTVADPGQVVWLEKRREDAIRREGHPVERIVWDELARPGLIGARIRRARVQVKRPQADDERPSA